MNPEIIKVIETLAAKLGTTAEYLWGVLIKQAPISGMCDILGFVIVGSILFCLYILVRKTEYADSDAEITSWGGLGIASLIVLIALLTTLTDIISCFANPEYWALKQIIK